MIDIRDNQLQAILLEMFSLFDELISIRILRFELDINNQKASIKTNMVINEQVSYAQNGSIPYNQITLKMT